MVNLSMIGGDARMVARRERLAARREALGYTQESFAHKLHVELSTVGRWERGTLTPQPWRRSALARALEVSLEELDALLNPPHTGGLSVTRREMITDAARLTSAVVAHRVANRGPWQTPNGEDEPARLCTHARTVRPATLAEATALVAHAHCGYQAARYGEVARTLPTLTDAIDALIAQAPTAQRREALRLRGSMSIVAAKLATKGGDGATALTAAEQARVSAELADDAFGRAAAAYQFTCALLCMARSDEAEYTAQTAAEAIRGRDPESLTWRGALTLISALIAARRNDLAEVSDRLDHAEDLAQHLGTDGNIGWTAFGPTNVLIHRLSAAVAMDNPHGVLALAERIDVTAMPSGLRGRQAQFHLDNAWAHGELGQDPLAVIHLLDTERVAPEILRAHDTAYTLVQDLLARERRDAGPGLRGLALRIGVAA